MMSWDELDFHKCPRTGRVLESRKDAKTVACSCGGTDPRPNKRHDKSKLKTATVEEYKKQYGIP